MRETLIEANNIQFSQICLKIEGLCAQLYHNYSKVYADNRDAAQLWAKTALEEENHQKQFKNAIMLMEEIDFELTLTDLKNACDVHRKLCLSLDLVKKNPPDLITALTKSIEIEKHLAELHVQTAVRFKDDSVIKMLKTLQLADQEHVKSLQQLLSLVSISNGERNA